MPGRRHAYFMGLPERGFGADPPTASTLEYGTAASAPPELQTKHWPYCTATGRAIWADGRPAPGVSRKLWSGPAGEDHRAKAPTCRWTSWREHHSLAGSGVRLRASLTWAHLNSTGAGGRHQICLDDSKLDRWRD